MSHAEFICLSLGCSPVCFYSTTSLLFLNDVASTVGERFAKSRHRSRHFRNMNEKNGARVIKPSLHACYLIHMITAVHAKLTTDECTLRLLRMHTDDVDGKIHMETRGRTPDIS